MADKVGEVYVDMDIKTDKVHSGLNQVENKANSATNSINSGFKNTAMGVAVGTLAVQGAEMAFSALKNQVVDAFAQYADGVRTQAQLQAVLKSTGGVARVTADDVNNLATEIMKMSGIDDEAVVSAQNIMLTFTGIGKDVFPEATKSAVDMAVALNGGLTPSAEELQAKVILVGKALQDPDAGLGALKRVGVNVDELSKKFTDSMSIQEKQKLILQELGTEFGGSAKAMGETLPGKINILKENFNNLKQELAGKFIKVVEQLMASLAKWWETAKVYVIPALQLIGDMVKQLVAEFMIFWNKNKDWLIPLLQGLAILIGVIIVGALMLLIGAFWASIKIVGFMYDVVRGHMDLIIMFGFAIVHFGQTVWEVLTRVWQTVVQVFMAIYNTINNAMLGAYNYVVGIIVGIINTFIGIYEGVKSAMSNVYWAIRGPFETAFRWLTDKIDWVKEQLGKLDPTKRFSPSLVDRVTLGTGKIKQQYGALFESIGIGANDSRKNLNQLAPQNNTANNTNSAVNFYAPITLGDSGAVNTFFDKLNRNNELARKGLTVN